MKTCAYVKKKQKCEFGLKVFESYIKKNRGNSVIAFGKSFAIAFLIFLFDFVLPTAAFGRTGKEVILQLFHYLLLS